MKAKCACHYCGIYYRFGHGTDVDHKKALEYFLKSEEEKCKLSYFYLGCIYERGDGTEIDMEKAFYYYKLSADEFDNLKALGSVGYLYETGNGVEKNIHEALKYYKMAIDAGYTKVQENYDKLLKQMEQRKPDNQINRRYGNAHPKRAPRPK